VNSEETLLEMMESLLEMMESLLETMESLLEMMESLSSRRPASSLWISSTTATART
jgi:uncharacterized protein Yka (UPF0111/DUF47 family)